MSLSFSASLGGSLGGSSIAVVDIDVFLLLAVEATEEGGEAEEALREAIPTASELPMPACALVFLF